MTAKEKLVVRELNKIETKYGIITPRLVVAEANNPKSLLHGYFEWDANKAAEGYRFWQARQLIAKVRIVYEDRKLDAFYNVKISVEGGADQGYVSIAKVLSNKEMRKQVVAQALKELDYWNNKYKEYVELQNIVDSKKVKSLLMEVESEVVLL
jgi:hypothetical protein